MAQSFSLNRDFSYIIFYIRKKTFFILNGIKTEFFPGQLVIVDSDKLTSRNDEKKIIIPAMTLHEHFSLFAAHKNDKMVLYTRTKNHISVNIQNKEYMDKIFELFHLADTEEQKKCAFIFYCVFFINKKIFFLFVFHISVTATKPRI